MKRPLGALVAASLAVALFGCSAEPKKRQEQLPPVPVSQWCPSRASLGTYVGTIERAGDLTVARNGRTVDRPVLDETARWQKLPVRRGAWTITHADMAVGPFAYVLGPAAADDGAGLIGFACPRRFTEAWLLGLSGTDESPTSLEIANLGSKDAVVSLDWFGLTGAQARESRGVVRIGPGKTQRIDVRQILPGQSDLALRLVAERGWPAALAWRGGGKETAITSAAQPSNEQVITGIPKGKTRLVVVNPGEEPATVSAEFTNRSDRFVMRGLDSIVVEPESTKVVDLPREVDAAAGAIVITADRPVTAGLEVSSADDTAIIPSVPPRQTRIAIPRTVAGARGTLTFHAAQAGDVTLRARDDAGTTIRQWSVHVETGRSRSVDVGRLSQRVTHLLAEVPPQMRVGAAWQKADRFTTVVPYDLASSVDGPSVTWGRD